MVWHLHSLQVVACFYCSLLEHADSFQVTEALTRGREVLYFLKTCINGSLSVMPRGCSTYGE